MDEGPVEAVHGAESREIVRTGYFDLGTLNGNLDVRINFLRHLSERSFNLHHVAVEYLYGNSGRKVYRQFSYS